MTYCLNLKKVDTFGSNTESERNNVNQFGLAVPNLSTNFRESHPMDGISAKKCSKTPKIRAKKCIFALKLCAKKCANNNGTYCIKQAYRMEE